MDPPILDIKKEILLEELGDGNSNISGVLQVFVKEEMPVPRDTDLLQNDYTAIALNGLIDISHTSKEDHAVAYYPQEVQDCERKMDNDGQRVNIPGLGFETTKLWNLPLLSCCNVTNTNKDHHNHASIKTDESNSLPDVLEADVKLEEPSNFSSTMTGQNSYLVSKTTKTVPDFHPGAIDQLDSNQINGNKFPDCVDIKKEVIQLSSSSSQFFRHINPEQKLSPLLLGTISDKNLVHRENIETSVEKEDDKEHNSESTIVFRSSECHNHQPCSMISGQISISKNRSIVAKSEKEENDEDVISPNNHMSCTALTSKISDQVASYGGIDDVLKQDNEFSIVIDNAESDDVIKGKEAMDKVKKCQFIFTTQRLKQKGTCCGKKRCFSTPASLTNVRTVKKSLRNAKPKDEDDRNDDDLEAGESTSTLALSEDVEEGLNSNMFEKTRMSTQESAVASVSRETDSNADQMWKATCSTESIFKRHMRREHNGASWIINQKEINLKHSLKQDENVGKSEDQGMNGMQMDDHVLNSIDLKDPEIFKHCNYNQFVLMDENFELSSEIGRLLKRTIKRSREKLFKCEECGKSFSRKGTLQRHMRTHTGEKPFNCDECSRYFSEKSHLQTHMRSHTGEKPFRCNECGKCFSHSGNVRVHMRTHTRETSFKCNKCGKCFNESATLRAHKRTHKSEKPFKCDKCDKCFGESATLRVHMRTHTREKPFKCDECVKCFGLKSHLQRHMRIHTGEKPFICDECGLCYSDISNLRAHMRKHRGQQSYKFKCDECGKRFGHKINLSVHMRTHTGERPYRCDHCGKCFSQRSSLPIHMRIHTGEKPFTCDECHRLFNHKGSLQRHMRTHTGEMPFSCDECGKLFSDSSTLRAHKRTHTGEKPFRCNECGKCFSHSGNIRVHMRTHTGEKPFKCDECGKCFGEKCHLQSHVRSHGGETPFKCNECGKSFRDSSSLRVHMRTHTGEKPFRCDECGKCFSRSDNVRVHMRTHTGEKPFKCNECGKCYSDVSNLRAHMRKHRSKAL